MSVLLAVDPEPCLRLFGKPVAPPVIGGSVDKSQSGSNTPALLFHLI